MVSSAARHRYSGGNTGYTDDLAGSADDNLLRGARRVHSIDAWSADPRTTPAFRARRSGIESPHCKRGWRDSTSLTRFQKHHYSIRALSITPIYTITIIPQLLVGTFSFRFAWRGLSLPMHRSHSWIPSFALIFPSSLAPIRRPPVIVGCKLLRLPVSEQEDLPHTPRRCLTSSAITPYRCLAPSLPSIFQRFKMTVQATVLGFLIRIHSCFSYIGPAIDSTELLYFQFRSYVRRPPR
ncbi:hypothetical protein DFH08DRAFT_518762 [Mycena albidolilacea]|uniref:Uncharacterized protein n=1 Tax=Mycena albidolilacea TaxID=1033008 RepID=A0AAD7EAG4_9AGAR|nr:hypothetical protein DFH08DRAFT_518762 [Mycena albidolilacea]